MSQVYTCNRSFTFNVLDVEQTFHNCFSMDLHFALGKSVFLLLKCDPRNSKSCLQTSVLTAVNQNAGTVFGRVNQNGVE